MGWWGWLQHSPLCDPYLHAHPPQSTSYGWIRGCCRHSRRFSEVSLHFFLFGARKYPVYLDPSLHALPPRLQLPGNRVFTHVHILSSPRSDGDLGGNLFGTSPLTTGMIHSMRHLYPPAFLPSDLTIYTRLPCCVFFNGMFLCCLLSPIDYRKQRATL